MKPKLTLKTNSMGILITVWVLMGRVTANQGVPFEKVEYFLYFSSRKIHQPTSKYG